MLSIALRANAVPSQLALPAVARDDDICAWCRCGLRHPRCGSPAAAKLLDCPAKRSPAGVLCTDALVEHGNAPREATWPGRRRVGQPPRLHIPSMQVVGARAGLGANLRVRQLAARRPQQAVRRCCVVRAAAQAETIDPLERRAPMHVCRSARCLVCIRSEAHQGAGRLLVSRTASFVHRRQACAGSPASPRS